MLLILIATILTIVSTPIHNSVRTLEVRNNAVPPVRRTSLRNLEVRNAATNAALLRSLANVSSNSALAPTRALLTRLSLNAWGGDDAATTERNILAELARLEAMTRSSPRFVVARERRGSRRDETTALRAREAALHARGEGENDPWRRTANVERAEELEKLRTSSGGGASAVSRAKRLRRMYNRKLISKDAYDSVLTDVLRSDSASEHAASARMVHDRPPLRTCESRAAVCFDAGRRSLRACAWTHRGVAQIARTARYIRRSHLALLARNELSPLLDARAEDTERTPPVVMPVVDIHHDGLGLRHASTS